MKIFDKHINSKSSRAEPHLSGLIRTVSHPDKQKIRIIGLFFENSLILAVCSSAVTICSMYLRLNLSTTSDLLFQKPQHYTVLDLITGNLKASWFCRIINKFSRRAKPIRINSVRINEVPLYNGQHKQTDIRLSLQFISLLVFVMLYHENPYLHT
jgi:hypothetical protein